MLTVYLDGRKVTGMVPNFQFSFGYMFLSVVSYGFRDWRDFTLACAVLATPFVFTYVIWPESPRWLYNKVSKRLYIPGQSRSFNVTLPVREVTFKDGVRHVHTRKLQDLSSSLRLRIQLPRKIWANRIFRFGRI